MSCLSSGFSSADSVLKFCRHMPTGFDPPKLQDASLEFKRPKKPSKPIVIESVSDLKKSIAQGYRVHDLDVRGDIATLLKSDRVHPVVKSLYERKINSSKPGERSEGDHAKIAIAIEGGGMRGCVAAGMISVSILVLTQFVLVGN